MAHQDLKVHLGLKEMREREVPQEHQADQEKMDVLEMTEHLDLMEKLAILVNKD